MQAIHSGVPQGVTLTFSYPGEKCILPAVQERDINFPKRPAACGHLHSWQKEPISSGVACSQVFRDAAHTACRALCLFLRMEAFVCLLMDVLAWGQASCAPVLASATFILATSLVAAATLAPHLSPWANDRWWVL